MPIFRLLIGAMIAIASVQFPGPFCEAQQAESRNAKSAKWTEWPKNVEAALAKAGKNRDELVKALKQAPDSQKPAIEFLVANMPENDLKNLTAEFLIEHVRLAYEAREKSPWGEVIPDDIFLNDVVAYANVNEKREAWRADLYEKAWPIVKDCKTPAEAAQKLNEQLFKLVKVKYSTKRKRPDQAPSESIEQGLASCTGLSILLSDACRSVCVPARLAGTPLWTNKRGNHTWVEIWDGDWHFTGACEPDKNGLNRGWFVNDASQAQKDSKLHAIYATSFKKTGTHFPLVWARRDKSVPAVNVTERYNALAKPKKNVHRLMIRVTNAKGNQRLAMPVRVSEIGSDRKWNGTSKDESADTNDFLTFDVSLEREYQVELLDTDGKQLASKKVKTGKEKQTIVTIEKSD